MRRERGSVGVVLPARLRRDPTTEERMRVIGLDITGFGRSGGVEDGRLVRLGRIDLKRDRLARFAGS